MCDQKKVGIELEGVHMRLVLLQKSAIDVSAFWCNKDPTIYTPEN